MTTIKIKLKINIEEEIEIEATDLMHQSIEEYMDYVEDNLHEYLYLTDGVEWEMA